MIGELAMKYLLLLILIGVVWWSWKKRNMPPAPPPEKTDVSSQKMLVCAHCGVYFPAADASTANAQVYCCDAHRQAARQAGQE